MKDIVTYFLLFIIYAFLGWLLEVTCTLIEKKKFVNRGFLIGPICPIYGHGVILILLLIGQRTDDLLSVFLKSLLICSVLEYFTSFFLEKVFKARWWDYSSKKFNINGRICLETMLPFGIFGTMIVYYINPFFLKILHMIPQNVLNVMALILLIIYLVDNIISCKVMSKIKGQIKKSMRDNTETIKNQINDWLDKNTILYRHIKHAYPKFKINIRHHDN